MLWKERFIWTAVIIALVFYFTKCNKTVCPEIQSISYDTTIIVKHDSSSPFKTLQPTNELLGSHIDTFIEYQPYAVEVEKIREVDTAAILADYFQMRYYEDTTKLHYADIITKDSITQNKIWRHKVDAIFKVPEITKTVTVSQPKKSHIFIGLNAGYNNVGANLSFENTKSRFTEVGTVLMQGRFYYFIGKKWKIK